MTSLVDKELVKKLEADIARLLAREETHMTEIKNVADELATMQAEIDWLHDQIEAIVKANTLDEARAIARDTLRDAEQQKPTPT